MNRWIICFAISIVAFLGAIFALFNFWAACDLGYDTSANGKIIIERWGYALIGFFACGIVFMILAIKSWFSSRRTVNQSMGKV